MSVPLTISTTASSISPDPIPLDAADYYDRLAAQIRQLAAASYGHALVLFTSLLRHVGGQGTAASRGAALPCIYDGQTPGPHPGGISRRPGSILLATGAAWEGLDFAGDGVSLAHHPAPALRLPDAVKRKESVRTTLNLQGVPALRRCPGNADQTAAGLWPGHPHRNGHLLVAVLDPRAARGRRYFQSMVEALPGMPVTGSLRAVEQFYRDRKGAGYFRLPNAG